MRLGSDWAQLESQTFRFRDPLNKERRFVPLRLDDAPAKGSLGQFLYINWLLKEQEQEYRKLLDACRPLIQLQTNEVGSGSRNDAEKVIQLRLQSHENLYGFALSRDRQYGVSCAQDYGDNDCYVWLWDMRGQFLNKFAGHKNMVSSLKWSPDGQFILSGSHDTNVRLWDVRNGICVSTFKGHTGDVSNFSWTTDQQYFLSCSNDRTVRLWNTLIGTCVHIFNGHTDGVRNVVWSGDQLHFFSSSNDCTIRLWNIRSKSCVRIFEGHTSSVMSLFLMKEHNQLLSGSHDGSCRLWDINIGRCLKVLEGHEKAVRGLVVSSNGHHALSCSDDRTIRLWDLESGGCLRVLTGHKSAVISVDWNEVENRAFSVDTEGCILVWKVPEFSEKKKNRPIELALPDQVQYTNAKILVVGDTNAGKTGLTHRIAMDEWKPSEDSTVGAWSTQFSLRPASTEQWVDREIWLWDFGGQADQRVIHQLYMDRTALILQLFNADQEDVLPGLRDWQTALRRSVKEKIPHFLVAGRIDTGFKASREKLRAFAQEQGMVYYETSAKEGTGCNELREAMIAGIQWEQMEQRTSPRIFKLIKDEILKLRDEGQVLHTFKELRELLWRRMPDEPRFADEKLQTVLGLLDGPGVVKELDYGTYILLVPEWINAYAQAVIRTLRSADNDLGVLPLRSIAEGKLIYQSIGRDGILTEMKRLPHAEERVVLGEMERQLELRGLCVRQGDKLVFPSHCGRDRHAVLAHPSVFVSYSVKGFLDDIYATLVVKLADSESFHLKEHWRDAADFVTLIGDHHMGIKLTRESSSDGSVSVYFGKGVTEQEQVIFANYIHGHLERACEQAVRLRHYVCPRCATPKGNAEVLMKKLLLKKQEADTECDACGVRFPLWDELERKFASEAVRKQVEELQTDDLAKLTSRRKGKLLVLDVGARITSANQKWMEVPGDEDDGIDMILEFTNEDGNGVGRGLCLQLKSGNSHLKTRKSDGAEIFTIDKPRWVDTWMNQPYPVMLVIGTFAAEDERVGGKERVEFADVRWMEISSVLRRERANGTRPVKQIEFKGERMDMASVRRWRERVLNRDFQD